MDNQQLFDWLGKKKLSDENNKDAITNQIATDDRDGAIVLEDSVNEFMVNFDFIYNNEADLIQTYREISKYNEVDFAIEDVVNEAVNFGDDEDKPISLDLSRIDDDVMSKKIKDLTFDSWEKIMSLLDLSTTIHTRFKNFYIDGRLSYHKVVDKQKVKDGLQAVIELDPIYVTKFRNINYSEEGHTITSIDEFFVYNEEIPNGPKSKSKTRTTVNNKRFKKALKLHRDSLAYVTSGMVDPETGTAIGWLHKAVKPANQLRMMENALVITRITRAPERRIFYVDVAGLPKTKAEQYIKNLKASYRNRMSYDPDSGNFKDKRHLMTMQEDYWMPRNSTTGKGTEVDTLAGASNLGDIEDVVYFLKRLYKALNIPTSRLESDSIVSLGRDTEISRDELKFSKFVNKVKKRFNKMLLDLLKTEMILTKIITVDEWDKISEDIRFIYSQDMYLEEQKKFEMLRDRLELLRDIGEHVGKYFSHDFVRREILKQTDEEIQEQDKLIEKEKSDPKYKGDDEEPQGF